MEDVRLLARAIIRAFYTDEHAAIMESLLNEPYYLRDDQSTFGSLYQTMGSLHAKKSRQILTELVEHGLIGKWESQDETEKGQKVYYYYCDFVHFVKTIHLRLFQMEKRMKDESSERVTAQVPAFRCPKCARNFTEMQVLSCPMSPTGAFLCSDDRTILSDDLQNQTVSKKTSSDVLKQFGIQMQSERDLRDDGIRPLLDRIDANASAVVEIRPPFRKRTLDGALKGSGDSSSAAGAANSGKGRGGNDIYFDESVEKRAGGSTVPSFLLRSSVTNEKTEEAIIMERERNEREMRARTEANEAQQREARTELWKKQLELEEKEKASAANTTSNNREPSPPIPTSSQSGNVYVMVAGKQIALDDVTEDDVGRMTPEEYFDYTAKCDEAD